MKPEVQIRIKTIRKIRLGYDNIIIKPIKISIDSDGHIDI
jgi:hypothetical protein